MNGILIPALHLCTERRTHIIGPYRPPMLHAPAAPVTPASGETDATPAAVSMAACTLGGIITLTALFLQDPLTVLPVVFPVVFAPPVIIPTAHILREFKVIHSVTLIAALRDTLMGLVGDLAGFHRMEEYGKGPATFIPHDQDITLVAIAPTEIPPYSQLNLVDLYPTVQGIDSLLEFTYFHHSPFSYN
jgi:hypothetical protein